MRHWTLEERQKQSELIHRWRPWNQSTGAKTPAGRERSKMNALKHGGRSAEMKSSRAFIAGCRHSEKLVRDL